MYWPNYKDGSIANLMSSIAKALGGKTQYIPLKILKPSEIKTKNVVLLVVDGLGYDYLMKKGKNSFMKKHLKGKMTSVYPATTAAGVTTFFTGVPSQQSGLTGWYVYLREAGAVSTPLPFVFRGSWQPINEASLNFKKVFGNKPFSSKIKAKGYVIQDEAIQDSYYTVSNSGRSKRLGFKTLRGMFMQIKKALKSSNAKKFIYSYDLVFDLICHHDGPRSKLALEYFKEIDARLERFVKSIKGTDTTLIITADHGQVDTSKSKTVMLSKHPELAECLMAPLCGDLRSVYCYIYPKKKKQFEKYVKTKLKKYCKLYKSSDLVKEKRFGLFKPHPELKHRVGDYTLVMKENYVMRDFVAGETPRFHKGDHGGTSKEEMFVPLVVIKV